MQLQGKLPLQNSPAMDIFKQLVTSFDSEGRYHLFNAMANQLRYPNRYIIAHIPNLFSLILLFLSCPVLSCPDRFHIVLANCHRYHYYLEENLFTFTFTAHFSPLYTAILLYPHAVIRIISRALSWLCSERQIPRLSKNRLQGFCWKGLLYTDRTL